MSLILKEKSKVKSYKILLWGYSDDVVVLEANQPDELLVCIDTAIKELDKEKSTIQGFSVMRG